MPDRPALSTVAMTAYNALAVRGPSTRAEVAAFCWKELGWPVMRDELEEALARLVELRRVTVSEAGVYQTRGPRGAVVRNRNRIDRSPDPGWGGWMLDVPNRGRVLLEEYCR